MQPTSPALALSSPEKSTIGRLRPVPAPPWLRAGMRMASTVAPGAAALLARKLFFTPRRARLRDAEREVLARGEIFSLEVGGQTVVGRVWGQGPTVLLAHGWGGHSGQMTAFADSDEAGHPFRGESGHPAGVWRRAGLMVDRSGRLEGR